MFRADSFSRVRRHTLVPPSDAETPLRHLVVTLLDQGHLCPLPLTVQPVYWDYDHALRLFPLPDVVRGALQLLRAGCSVPVVTPRCAVRGSSQVVLADDCDEYHLTYEDCLVFNPGSFPRDTGFMVYKPASREAEVSRVHSEATQAT